MSPFQEVPVKNLVPSKLNYRTHMDAAALKELTASVKSKGVLQPILVRPLNGKQKGKYEIVAGHRRHQAAEAAGLKQMPAMVRELNDEEALEVNVIENTQREDPNPMDEAVGFKRLLEMGKHTPETLAAKLDVDTRYVLARVKLADLSKPVQMKIASGEIPLGVAKLFTRLKNEGAQKKFLQAVIEDGDVTVKRAERMIEEYTMGLSSAVFATDACASCPSNSGNQAALFPEIGKDDKCSDRSCFQTKTKQHYMSIIKEAEANGFKVFRKWNDVCGLTGYNGKGHYITRLKKDADYETEAPKKYSTDCAKCTEHHAYYLAEIKQTWSKANPTIIKFGEICLNKKCLKAMQAAGKKEERSERATASSSAQDDQMEQMRRRSRAAGCRDRFLLREITERLKNGGARMDFCNDRISLFILLGKYYKNTDTLKGFLKAANVPLGELEKAPIGIHYDIYHYALASLVPAERLHDAIDAVILTTLEDIKGANLLQIAPHAGLDVQEAFTIDRAFITSQSFKNKGDLIKLAAEFGLDVNEKASKENIVDEMLSADLKGKIPAEIAETLVIEKAEMDEEEADEYCDDCGDEAEDCACEGGPDLSGGEEAEEGEPEIDTEIDPTMPQPTATGKGKKKDKRARACA